VACLFFLLNWIRPLFDVGQRAEQPAGILFRLLRNRQCETQDDQIERLHVAGRLGKAIGIHCEPGSAGQRFLGRH